MASFTTSVMTSATPQSIAAAYSSSSSMVFVPGSLATIQNLKSENGKKLNGKIARVVKHTKGKVVVTVDNGKRFKVNSFNLIVVEPEKEPKNETQKDTKKNNKQNQRKKKRRKGKEKEQTKTKTPTYFRPCFSCGQNTPFCADCAESSSKAAPRLTPQCATCYEARNGNEVDVEYGYLWDCNDCAKCQRKLCGSCAFLCEAMECGCDKTLCSKCAGFDNEEMGDGWTGECFACGECCYDCYFAPNGPGSNGGEYCKACGGENDELEHDCHISLSLAINTLENIPGFELETFCKNFREGWQQHHHEATMQGTCSASWMCGCSTGMEGGWGEPSNGLVSCGSIVCGTASSYQLYHKMKTKTKTNMKIERTPDEETEENDVFAKEDLRSAAERNELQQLPWLEVDGRGSGYSTGEYIGICYKNKTDQTRYKICYNSLAEKYWCECHDLADHGFFQEASLRIPHISHSNRRIQSELIERINDGIAESSGKYKDETPQDCFTRKTNTIMAKFDRNLYVIEAEPFFTNMKKLTDVIEEYEKILIPQKDMWEVTGGHGHYEYKLNMTRKDFLGRDEWKEGDDLCSRMSGVIITQTKTTSSGPCSDGSTDGSTDGVTTKEVKEGTLSNGDWTGPGLNFQDAYCIEEEFGCPAHTLLEVRCSKYVVFDDQHDLVFDAYTVPFSSIVEFKGKIKPPKFMPDWSKATTINLMINGRNWFLIGDAYNQARIQNDETDAFIDAVQMICSALIKKSELKCAVKLASTMVEKYTAQMDPYCGPGWFLCMLAEVCEVNSQPENAYQWYRQLGISGGENNYGDDPGYGSNMLEKEFEAVNIILAEGTLEERLARTRRVPE